MVDLYNAISSFITDLISKIPQIVSYITKGIEASLSLFSWLPISLLVPLTAILGILILIAILRTVL